MRVALTVLADVSLLDDDLGDPVAGDPLEDRMRESTRQAVANALELSDLNGFTHDMDTLTAIQIHQVQVSTAQPEPSTRSRRRLTSRGLLTRPA